MHYGVPADKRDLTTKYENLKVMHILKILFITLQEMWLEFLWCRERLQWKSGMPRIGVGDAEIKINEKGQKFLFV